MHVTPGLGKTAMGWFTAFFAVSALGFFAGAAWSYLDEYSGRSGEATVLKCERHGSSPRQRNRLRDTYCTGRWSVDGRERTGDIYNAKPGDVGKTLAVRIHDDHASRPQPWVMIGLLAGGVFVGGIAVMMFVQMLRARHGPPEPTAPL